MTTDSELETRSDLNAELKSLLRRAYANEIDIEGGWECLNHDDHPNWDVIVTEVRKKQTQKQD